MIEGKYKYTDAELKKLLKSITILVDSREQKNEHILQWFDEHKIKYEIKKLDWGDYSFYLPQNDEFSISRSTYYTEKISIERKASCDELIGNFANDRDRIEDEFLRHKGKMILAIEDGTYNDIRNGKYQSKYNSKSAVGTLHSFFSRYEVPFIFLKKEDMGCFIYCTFYYYLREQIK